MDRGAMSAYAAILARSYAQRAGLAPVAAAVAEASATVQAETVPNVAAAGNREVGGGGIALIRVFGPIVQRASELGPCEGGTGAVEIGRALDAAMADQTVSQILMQFSTPGGSVFGIRELGDKIRNARSKKAIVGLADSQAASAGYWLLSQCSEAYCTPGGMAGSIGVYGAHEDVSKALENEGINITLISAGKYKVEGHPFAPLSEEAKTSMQAQIDAYYSMFTQAVSRGRGVPVEQVRSGMGEGRQLLASDALDAKMVDGVMTFDEVVHKMQRDAKAQRTPRSALAAARAHLVIAA
jgi:signal peptide peptidase SppA